MIWLLTPTHGRPDAMRGFVESVRNTALEPWRAVVVFGVDHDDEPSHTAAVELGCQAPCFAGHCGAHWRKLSLSVPALDDDLVMLCADDIRFESPGWDHKMLEQSEHGVLYFGEDGIQHDALATHPWMTARTARALDGLTTGEWATYNDTWLWCLFGLFSPPRRVYRPDIVTRHHWAGENPRNVARHGETVEKMRTIGSKIAMRQFRALTALVPRAERVYQPAVGLHGLSMSLDSSQNVTVAFA